MTSGEWPIGAAKGKQSDTEALCQGGALRCRARAGRAPGIFFDPCPTGDLFGGCTKRSARTVQLFGRLAVLESRTL